MTILRGDVSVEVLAIGLLEAPVIATGGIPANAEVGNAITPTVNVMRADGITAVEGVSVDFLVIDDHGCYTLGARQTTDVAGDATSPSTYYIGEPDAGQDITFIIVVRPKVMV